MEYKVVKNELGYFEVENKPDEKVLAEYYAEKYYASSEEAKYNKYQRLYSSEELLFKENRAARKKEIILNLRPSWELKGKRVLDIGCGEGWNLNYFHSFECDVIGVEYQTEACESLNPHLTSKIKSGNIWDVISKMASDKESYDIIILDNVLEHVINPLATLEIVKSVLSKDGVLVIEVPNDYSLLQNKLKEGGYISRDFWFAPPDHLSYFNLSGLNNLLDHSHFMVEHMSCDFPIDFNLFNEDTNYIEDKTKGKKVHFSRVAIENLFDSISVEKTNELYQVLADMGLGRNIIGYYKHKK